MSTQTPNLALTQTTAGDTSWSTDITGNNTIVDRALMSPYAAQITPHSSLQFAHRGLRYQVGSSVTSVSSGTVAVSSGVTSQVYLDVSSSGLAATTGSVPAGDVWLYTVVVATSANTISGVTDRRSLLRVSPTEYGKQTLSNTTTASIGASSSLSGNISILANEIDLMLISLDPASTSADSFKVELYGTSSHGSAQLYARLTSTGSTDFSAGDTLRAPGTGGYAPIAWYRDNSTGKQIHYLISNTSTSVASAFTLGIDYRPITG